MPDGATAANPLYSIPSGRKIARLSRTQTTSRPRRSNGYFAFGGAAVPMHTHHEGGLKLFEVGFETDKVAPTGGNPTKFAS